MARGEQPRGAQRAPAVDDRAVSVKPGTLLAGKYQVTGTLGRGGMGIVVSANHTVLRQPVALKFLLPGASPTTIERFLREAQSAASLQSEHVARVSDTGTLDNGSPYIVMEFLEGEDLAQMIERRGFLRLPEAVDYVLQTLDALSEAHAKGIVHRDLKPSNLFIARRADGSTSLKVLDFGLAKAEVFGADAKLTRKETILGTPYYISPEQFRSSSTVDSRSDLWSLGVILYEVLAGKRPFVGSTPGDILAAIFEGIPRSVREKRPDVPAEIEDIIRKCLSRDIETRFQNAAELASALAPFGSGREEGSVQRAIAFRSKPITRALPATAPLDGPTIRIAAVNTPATGFGPQRTPAPVAPAPPALSGVMIGLIAMITTVLVGLVAAALILVART
jgi:serine/threonine protein kinase